MQPGSVVILLDELLQTSLQVFEVAVRSGVDLFALERFQKTLAGGIVVWIRRPTHARQHPMIEELLDVLSAGILHALIGVVHDSRRRLSIHNCPL
jgi:hypothetical protein